METNQDKYARAAARVDAIRNFYWKVTKLLVFILSLLVFHYFIYELRGVWFIWIIGFVSIGLVAEGAKLFGLNLIFGKDWERRKIEAEMLKEDSNSIRF